MFPKRMLPTYIVVINGKLENLGFFTHLMHKGINIFSHLHTLFIDFLFEGDTNFITK